MAKSKVTKNALRAEIEKAFNKASAAIVAEYKGVEANELAELRAVLHNAGCELKVIKNTLARKAIGGEATKSREIGDFLKGQIAVAYFYGDVASGAKELLKFSKDHEKVVILGGVLDERKVTLADVKALASLPSKEELLARIVGTLVAPHRGLLTVINGVSSGLVRTIAAIKDQKAS
jgi:large subunit ribosomal protein L10